MNRLRRTLLASFVLGCMIFPGCVEEGSVATVAPAPPEDAKAVKAAGGKHAPKSIGTQPTTSLAPE